MPGKRKVDEIEGSEGKAVETTTAATEAEEPSTTLSSSSSTAAKPKTKSKPKKKAPKDDDDDFDDDDGDDEEEDVKPKMTKKALAALEKEEKRKHLLESKAKMAKKLDSKPLSAEDNLLARGASMHRNRAIIAFVKTVKAAHEEAREFIKVASDKKAIKSLEELTEPIILPKKLLALEGIGKGTVEKITKFLLEEYEPVAEEEEEEGTGSSSSSSSSGTTTLTGSHAVADKNPDEEWIKDSDRDVIMNLLKKGELMLDKVKLWRQDIDSIEE